MVITFQIFTISNAFSLFMIFVIAFSFGSLMLSIYVLSNDSTVPMYKAIYQMYS